METRTNKELKEEVIKHICGYVISSANGCKCDRCGVESTTGYFTEFVIEHTFDLIAKEVNEIVKSLPYTLSYTVEYYYDSGVHYFTSDSLLVARNFITNIQTNSFATVSRIKLYEERLTSNKRIKELPIK